jgi:hypothetical protein
MLLSDVAMALMKVLDRVQTVSGLPSPTLSPTSIPTKVLPKFDSTVWPVATSWLGKELGFRIDNDVHIFGGKGGRPLLSITQTSELVLAHYKKKSATVPVAAE